MSLYDYRKSIEISANDPPFYALIMSAMRQADTQNAERLKKAWPSVWIELEARYNAPGGLLDDEYIPQPKDYVEDKALGGQPL